MSAWCLHDVCMMSVWCLYDVCVMSVWCLHDVCMMSAWCLHDVCMMSAWCLCDASSVRGIWGQFICLPGQWSASGSPAGTAWQLWCLWSHSLALEGRGFGCSDKLREFEQSLHFGSSQSPPRRSLLQLGVFSLFLVRYFSGRTEGCPATFSPQLSPDWRKTSCSFTAKQFEPLATWSAQLTLWLQMWCYHNRKSVGDTAISRPRGAGITEDIWNICRN